MLRWLGYSRQRADAYAAQRSVGRRRRGRTMAPGLLLQRGVIAIGPLPHRSVVDTDVVVTEQVHHEGGVRGADATLAVRDGWLLAHEPGLIEQRLQLVRREEH